jgi:hypothetical protein
MAAHVRSTDWSRYCPLFLNFPPLTPHSTALTQSDPPLWILGRMPRTLRVTSALTASWPCQHCSSNNNSAKNKRRCVSCQAWRDRIAPLSATGIAIANAHGGSGTSFCSKENDVLNNTTPRKVGSPTKRGAKRKSPSRGLGGIVLHPLPPQSPLALQPTRSITPPPPSQCRGDYDGFFGLALTFAAKSMEHTANQLRQWAREPNLGVKSFANSILLTSRSICILS